MNDVHDTSVARYLCRRLREVGIDRLFAVPGDYVTSFLDEVLADGGLDCSRCPTSRSLRMPQTDSHVRGVSEHLLLLVGEGRLVS